MSEEEEELNFDDVKEVLIYIAQKLGKIEEISKNAQMEIVLLRKYFLKFMKYIIFFSNLSDMHTGRSAHNYALVVNSCCV